MEFTIRVKFNGKFYRYPVKLAEKTEREEVYHVITRAKTLELRNNRPFFINRGLKHRRPTWKMDEALPYKSFTNDIIEEIEKNIGIQ
ncbi:hypothetical protein [Flavisolibacter nicotianae]|uniref:hypothetical protein n=1 Tax=Flavisolibacter nicotianae TaxID=2364882 RepID=UPI000EAD7C96|nr:hypothetical protein [Flavisolibacter nicotianae]